MKATLEEGDVFELDLEEVNARPEDLVQEQLLSKGFFPHQDFLSVIAKSSCIFVLKPLVKVGDKVSENQIVASVVPIVYDMQKGKSIQIILLEISPTLIIVKDMLRQRH